MRKIILAFVLCTLSLSPLFSQDAPVQKLNVHMMDGQVVTFLLDDEPVTKFEPGQQAQMGG